VDIFLTREAKRTATHVLTHLEEADKIVQHSEGSESEIEVDGVTIHGSGRPHLSELIPSAVGEGRTVIIGCGPEGLKIDLSNAAARLQSRIFRGEAQEISLHTESFDW
jgi:hypothetical protein